MTGTYFTVNTRICKKVVAYLKLGRAAQIDELDGPIISGYQIDLAGDDTVAALIIGKVDRIRSRSKKFFSGTGSRASLTHIYSLGYAYCRNKVYLAANNTVAVQIGWKVDKKCPRL
jgi:hypothetical protein